VRLPRVRTRESLQLVSHAHLGRDSFRTSGMAEDAIVLLDYISWTEPKSVHVVGISLGGMIAQGVFYHVVHDKIFGDRPSQNWPHVSLTASGP